MSPPDEKLILVSVDLPPPKQRLSGLPLVSESDSLLIDDSPPQAKETALTNARHTFPIQISPGLPPPQTRSIDEYARQSLFVCLPDYHKLTKSSSIPDQSHHQKFFTCESGISINISSTLSPPLKITRELFGQVLLMSVFVCYHRLLENVLKLCKILYNNYLAKFVLRVMSMIMGRAVEDDIIMESPQTLSAVVFMLLRETHNTTELERDTHK